MPNEEQPTDLPPQPPPDHEGWRQLAEDAARWPADHNGLQTLRENHVNRLLHEKGLGHLALTKEDKAGARFLHKNGNVDQAEVNHVVSYVRQNGTVVLDKAGDRMATYLSFMGDKNIVNDGILTGDRSSIDRQIEAHVIKTEDVPESHFSLQRRIAREQGHGDIEITQEMRDQLVEAAQADQRGSLDKWVEYLGGQDGGYPNWFKRYTWDSVLRLGKYNKEAGKFDRREADTVAAYPELSREALAYVFDTVNKSQVHGEKVEDATLQQLLKDGNFGRLYVHAMLASAPASPERRNEIRGSWTKFIQGDDPRVARRLSGSLQGHGTDWCTAGESTAEIQLSGGDFYVYYTRDEDGKDTVPRVAIRIENDSVAEVRGVNAHQELEPLMVDIATEQLQGLPGGESYIQKAADMKRLTLIDELISSNPQAELSKDDIKFLYELDHTIVGFGYERDPRLVQIRAKRGNLDHGELKVLAIEYLHESFAASYEGYSAIAQQIQGSASTQSQKHGLFGRRSHETETNMLDQAAMEEHFTAKLAEWQRDGVLDYVAERMITNGELHTPVFRPNIVVPVATLKSLANGFAEGQEGWSSAYVYDQLYDAYTSDQEVTQLSGYSLDQGPVAMSLVSSKVRKELGSSTVEAQLQKLAQLQADAPQLGLKVPSVLDALTYWQTLRARGDKLSDDSTFDKTYIRHFDLVAKKLDGWLGVPDSCVDGGGEPYLAFSFAGNRPAARLSVG